MLPPLLDRFAPKQLVIQLTDRCNARCPQCGMRVTSAFQRSTLDSDEVRRAIDAAAARGVKAISFTGGEPLLMLDTLIPLIQYAGEAGIPMIRTGTNGFVFTNRNESRFETRVRHIVDRLAETPLRNFWISLDSAIPDVHEAMRGFPSVVAGIEKALPMFHDAGIWPSVNLGINRNLTRGTMALAPPVAEGMAAYLTDFYREFQAAFRAFYRFVIDLGFTTVNSCYPMSIPAEESDSSLRAVYGASASDRVIRFTDVEKAVLYKALFDVIPEFRSRIRIFSPRVSLYSLMRQYTGTEAPAPYPCLGGVDFFYMDAKDGDTYPCGYRGGENMGRFWRLDRQKRRAAETRCTACDWECFRDPSELLGPVYEGLMRPAGLLGRLRNDPRFFWLWMSDVRYYRACGFFDGRKPPRMKQLARFEIGKNFGRRLPKTAPDAVDFPIPASGA